IGGALSTAFISGSIILAGIKTADSDVAATSIDAHGQLVIKIAMLVLPLIFIVAGYIIYLKKYKISEEFYAQILKDLKERGEMKEDAI
ncbi:MAG: sugar transporter, partial [Firmicutes bacterium]|nr:sugar transporter [Bacillota bacterium]